MITVQHVSPISGAALELWNAGHQSHLGPNSMDRVFLPNADLHAWIGLVDGVPVGIQAIRFDPARRRAHGPLSYVLPEYRRLGVYRRMQEVYEAALIAAGYTEIWSSVVNGPEAAAMQAAMEKRGGVVAQFMYRRPLKA